MIFSDIVERIVTGEKMINCVAISAIDGLIIEEWKREDVEFDLSAIAAEIALLLKELTRISAENGIPAVNEFSFGGSSYSVQVLLVEQDYFLFVVTSEILMKGKTRFYLKAAIPALRATL